MLIAFALYAAMMASYALGHSDIATFFAPLVMATSAWLYLSIEPRRVIKRGIPRDDLREQYWINGPTAKEIKEIRCFDDHFEWTEPPVPKTPSPFARGGRVDRRWR